MGEQDDRGAFSRTYIAVSLFFARIHSVCDESLDALTASFAIWVVGLRAGTRVDIREHRAFLA